MFEFYLYNRDYERIGILQNYTSVQWLNGYQTPGEVKIVAYSTEDNLANLVVGNLVYNTQDTSLARVVEVVYSETDDLPEMTVRAEMTAWRLDERVVLGTQNILDAEEGIYALYKANRRELPFGAASPTGLGAPVEAEVSWCSVLEGVQTLARLSGLGFRAQYDVDSACETLVVYKGTDRSQSGTEEYRGYFGDDIGNVSAVNITASDAEYRNVAIVAGEEDENGSRDVVTVLLPFARGDDRREIFVDAGDLSYDYQEAIDTDEVDENGSPVYEYIDKSYTKSEYQSLLRTRGLEVLCECLRSCEVSCEVRQESLRYGVDYFLGDRMPVKLTRYGLRMSAVVSAVRLIYESNGVVTEVELNDFRLEENDALFPFG